MKLIFADNYIESYTDDTIRGNGVVEISLGSNEFKILNLDDTLFEKFVFIENQYSLENGINKIIARKFIPNEDFFSLTFDADFFKVDDKFIFIYVNERLKKIEKSKYIVEYSDWLVYLKNGYVKLFKDNLLKIKTTYRNEILEDSLNHVFSVKEIVNDNLILVSTSTGCCKSIKDIEGEVKWRNKDKLLVDICIID